MINVDGDSSEEDEAIDSSNTVLKENFADEQPKQSISRKTVLLEPLADEEDEDEEDAPLPIVSISTTAPKENEEVLAESSVALIAQSEECAEALQAIESDAWDVNSWILFVEEVAEGRGGTISVDDAYSKFLDKFPRAAKFWKDLAEHHTKNGATSSAQEVYSKSLNKCYSVELWQSYIEFIRQTSKDRKILEEAFERAVESVGMSVDSYPLWRTFIDFQKELPDSDPGGKLSALRKVYQRAVSVPMDSLDTIWKEYESLEKQAGEHLAEKVLPEYNEKYLHAKAIFRDRKRLVAKIDMDRPATPPTNSIIELQQLDNWNRWIK
jgi:cleavage stimulation factor subunit 3